mmetsp:Transcript_86725/g.253810  ORF Transcript_86725/g.253810 Transcript_86725/m.253810 type:complete len:231 (-) Transcript_86725:218-910(-)
MAGGTSGNPASPGITSCMVSSGGAPESRLSDAVEGSACKEAVRAGNSWLVRQRLSNSRHVSRLVAINTSTTPWLQRKPWSQPTLLAERSTRPRAHNDHKTATAGRGWRATAVSSCSLQVSTSPSKMSMRTAGVSPICARECSARAVSLFERRPPLSLYLVAMASATASHPPMPCPPKASSMSTNSRIVILGNKAGPTKLPCSTIEWLGETLVGFSATARSMRAKHPESLR